MVPFLLATTVSLFSRGTRAQHLTLSGVCVMCDVCVVSPVWMRCSDRSTRQLYSPSQCVQLYSTCVHTTWAQHSYEESRNFGMSIDIAWFPDYDYLMASIFFIPNRKILLFLRTTFKDCII